MRNLRNKIDGACIALQSKARAAMQKKEGGVNGLVVEIGLVIVGVVLLALFNKQIGEFFAKTILSVTTKCEAILGTAV